MTTQTVDLSLEMQQALDALTENLLASEPFVAAAKANPVIAEFWQAQASLQASLQAANREISAVLGADFGRLARRSGCCS